MDVPQPMNIKTQLKQFADPEKYKNPYQDVGSARHVLSAPWYENLRHVFAGWNHFVVDA